MINAFNRVDNNNSIYQMNGMNLSNKEAFRIGYSNLITSLLKEGKRVVFVMDVPNAKLHPKYCLQKIYGLSFFHQDLECRFTKEGYELSRSQYFNEVLRLKVKFPSLKVYDPSDIFCNGSHCEITSGTKSLYYDDNHLSVHGSRIIIKNMMDLKIF